MRHFKDISFNKDISIWASGTSKDNIPKKDWQEIRDKTTTIGLNFFRLFNPHIRFWIDYGVTPWINTLILGDTTLITRPSAFLTQEAKETEVRHKIDYWFCNSVEHKNDYWRDGNYTIWMLLLMLRHYHPEVTIYLFGVDCHDDASTKYVNGELVVKHTNNQRNHMRGLLEAFTAQKNDNPWFFEKIYNCNPDSKAKMIQFKDYKEI